MSRRAGVPRRCKGRDRRRVTLALKILLDRPKSWAVSKTGEWQDMVFLPKRAVIRDEAGDCPAGAIFHVPVWLAAEKGLLS